MRLMRTSLSILIMLFLISFSVFAADEGESATLVYAEDPYEMEMYDTEENVQEVYIGDPVPQGYTLVTYNTSAELELPDGSILKIASDTNFQLKGVRSSTKEESSNIASLAFGKLRAVAAAGNANSTRVNTPTAVCGVRGTDFGVSVNNNGEFLAVKEGAVEFVKNTGESIVLQAGQYANALGETFQAMPLSAEQLSQAFEGMDFEQLDPAQVPGATSTEGTTEEEGEGVDTTTSETTEGEADKEKPEPNPVLEYLSEVLGMEIGSITIDGTTYSKAVLQPVFDVGKMRLGLYLPIIYSSDLFNPEDWYHPEGNNEWSFGTAEEDGGQDDSTLIRAQDFLNDLALKIRFFEWGGQRDDFYLRLGNLKTMTIGHGILMSNYANDIDFPAVRRLGVNMGVDLGSWGFESVVNDAGKPRIAGGRLYLKPAHKITDFAIGLSGITDLEPAVDLSEEDQEAYGNPIFANAAADLDLPILETDPFSFILFADGAGMVPYFRNDVPDSDITSGFAWNAFIKEDVEEGLPLRNYGLAAGAFGNALIMDWRLEYRNYHGIFKPHFYNKNYERQKGQYVKQMVEYLKNPNAEKYQNQTTGIYGEGGFSLMDKATFSLGYMWPWQITDDGIEPAEEDYLHLNLELKEGLIPIKQVEGVHGSISYDRTKFAYTLMEAEDSEDLSLFDANTTVKGEVIYPLAPTLDLAVTISTAVLHDEEGKVQYKDNGDPEIGPTISIETKVHF